ncbi:hypothetical protein DFH09DRAFT_1070392 [Mycena vulgaris]|nr:hypothetical protein DFH09DRAFT_1070392 [Mycena vulgaris]
MPPLLMRCELQSFYRAPREGRAVTGLAPRWPERKRKSQGLGSPETGVDSTKRTTTNQENIKYSKAVREVTYLDVRGISVMIRHAPYITPTFRRCANIEGEKSMRTRGRSVKTRGEKRKDAEERGILRPKPLDPTIRVKNMSKNRSLKNLKILRAEKSIRCTTSHASLHKLPGKRCLMRYGRRLPPHILVCCSFRLRVTRTVALQLIPPSTHPNGSPSLPVYLPFYEVGRRPLGRQRWAGWEDVEGGLHKEWGRDVPESVQGRPRSSGVVTYTNAGGIRRGEGKEYAREATLKRGDGPRKRQKRSASKNEGFAPRNECRSPRRCKGHIGDDPPCPLHALSLLIIDAWLAGPLPIRLDSLRTATMSLLCCPRTFSRHQYDSSTLCVL